MLPGGLAASPDILQCTRSPRSSRDHGLRLVPRKLATAFYKWHMRSALSNAQSYSFMIGYILYARFIHWRRLSTYERHLAQRIRASRERAAWAAMTQGWASWVTWIASIDEVQRAAAATLAAEKEAAARVAAERAAREWAKAVHLTRQAQTREQWARERLHRMRGEWGPPSNAARRAVPQLTLQRAKESLTCSPQSPRAAPTAPIPSPGFSQREYSHSLSPVPTAKGDQRHMPVAAPTRPVSELKLEAKLRVVGAGHCFVRPR